jgi:hypothetical protein
MMERTKWLGDPVKIFDRKKYAEVDGQSWGKSVVEALYLNVRLVMYIRHVLLQWPD